jgi:hypothetical protein
VSGFTSFRHGGGVAVDARFFAGRALSLTDSRGFRLPNTEKALCAGLLISEGRVSEEGCSQGNVGGEEGGDESFAVWSEKIPLGELEKAVFSDDNWLCAILNKQTVVVTNPLSR